MDSTEQAEPVPARAIPDDDRPFGPVAAAFISVGVGAFVLGLLTTLAEASESFKETLTFNERVGSLSGKTIIAVVAWLVSWLILHFVLRRKEPSRTVVWLTTGILVALGFLLTFPTFFQAFAPEE